jgi:hypothetical protein
MSLTGLFGSETAEKVLLYLARYQEGYASGISDTFEIPVSMVQRQLLKFEASGVLVSQLKGKTRLFLWNPRYAYLRELKELLGHALRLVPESDKQKYYMKRARPRRTGKPL